MLDQPEQTGFRDTTDLRAGRALRVIPAPVLDADPHRRRQRLKTAWAWRYRILALLAAAGVASVYGPGWVLGPVVSVDPVIRADFVKSVVVSGHVEAPNRIAIGSQVIGVVAEVPVAEGQYVRAGDVLVRLDDHEARAAVVAAEGAVALAEARIRQLRELTLPSAEQALRQAQANLRNAQQAHDRAATLARDSFGTRAALDDATKTLEVAGAQLRSAEFQVFTNQQGGSDYTMAETQLAQARANLAAAQSRLGYTMVVAPADGILIARNVERGFVVQPANVLMKLSPIGATQLVVDADEKNLGLLRVGQRALASADAFPMRSFAAELAYLNPGVDIDRATVQVKLNVPEPPAYLLQDMTVSVDIEVARRPSTLVLPSADLHEAGAAPWVLVAEGGRARRRPVRTGLAGIDKVEVLDGLHEGEMVVPTSAGIGPGGRLRARAESSP